MLLFRETHTQLRGDNRQKCLYSLINRGLLQKKKKKKKKKKKIDHLGRKFPFTLRRSESEQFMYTGSHFILWCGNVILNLQWRIWWDCIDAQADQGLRCPRMHEDMLSHVARKWQSKSQNGHPLFVRLYGSWLFNKIHLVITLRKHTYSNILQILSPKKWKFSDKKFWYFLCFCSKHRLWVLIRTASMRRF